MVWKYDVKKICGDTDLRKRPRQPYVICIKSHLKLNKRATITYGEMLDRKGTIKPRADYEFTKEDPTVIGKQGYQMPCEGDAGAGHWVEQGIAFGKRIDKAVLVGITTNTPTNRCGKYAHMQKTIHSEILDFIKEMAESSPIDELPSDDEDIDIEN